MQKKNPPVDPAQIKIVEDMQKEYKAFNEQQKLYDKLNSEIFTAECHIELFPLWLKAKKHFTVEQASGMANYLKFKRMTSLEGLTYNEIGFIFNFIESLNDFKCEQVGISAELFEEVLEHTYNEMAIGTWNKVVDSWKEDIAAEKVTMLETLNEKILELNALVEPNKKKLLRAQRTANNLTAHKK